MFKKLPKKTNHRLKSIESRDDEELTSRVTTALLGARLRFDITVEKLSARSGVSPDEINSIERGKALPAPPDLFNLCNVLGIQMSSLFQDEG